MAPQDDWSDSDDEAVAGVETSVLLGIPDGTIEAVSDIDDAAVSRIGGYPVRFILCMYFGIDLLTCLLKGVPSVERTVIYFLPVQSVL